ncbi:MAG: rRNA maturation RNase YbeY [Acidobacteriota bacterium]|nr:rRNA maturation RNase YbeY [Acidobacteriota bacterium]
MFEIINQQRKIKINPQEFKAFIQKSLDKIPETEGKILTIAFVSDKKIKDLNNQFRNKNSVTDVLSFIYESDEFEADENYLGDVVISVEQAKKQALENDLTLDLEIKQLILHGILHLCGYDHETDKGEMNKLELELRAKLGING